MTHYVTQTELAARLKINRTTVWRLEKAGVIKATKVGNVKRYDIEQIKK